MKKLNKVFAIILSILLFVSYSFGDDYDYNKEETVYVLTNSDGTIDKQIISTWVHSNNGKINIENDTILKNVKNIKSDEEITIKNNKIKFKSDNSDIYYRGECKKSLPFEVSVKYYLNDKEISAEKLLNKSGKLKIEIDFKNNISKEISIKDEKTSIYLPMAIAGTLNLPVDIFKNVEISSGKLINDAKNQIVTFVSFPGLKDSFDLKSDVLDETLEKMDSTIIIESDVTDFELDSFMIAATTELPDIADFENVDEILDKVNDIENKSEDLKGATSKLQDGQSKFSEKLSEYLAGVSKLNDGSNKLLEASNKLSEKSSIIYEGSTKIGEASKLFAEGITNYGLGSVKFSEGSVKFSTGAKEFSKGATAISDVVTGLVDKTKDLSDGSKKIDESLTAVKDNMKTANEGLEQLLSAVSASKKETVESIKTQIENYNLMIAKADESINAIKLLQVDDSQKVICENLIAGLTQQKVTLTAVVEKLNQKLESLSESDDNVSTLLKGYSDIFNALVKINEKTKLISDSTAKLSMGTQAFKDVKDKLSGAASLLETSSNSLVEGSKGLKDGSDLFNQKTEEYVMSIGKLTEGISLFHNEGMLKFNESMAAYTEGMNSLSKNNNLIIENENKLVNGSNKLNSSISEAVENNDENTNELIDDINKIKIIKDEMTNFANENLYFSEDYKNAKQSIKYIMKVKGIN